jgi:hypothetical protein
MYARIPDHYNRSDVEGMMLTIFPDCKLNWSRFSNVKIIAGKYKSARKSTAFLRQSGSTNVTLFYLECPDGTKVLNWLTVYDQVLVSLPFLGVTGLLSLFVSVQLCVSIIIITSLVAVRLIGLRKNKRVIDEAILNQINTKLRFD